MVVFMESQHSDAALTTLAAWLQRWLGDDTTTDLEALITPARVIVLGKLLRSAHTSHHLKTTSKKRTKRIVPRRCHFWNAHHGQQLIVCRNSIVDFLTQCRVYGCHTSFSPDDLLRREKNTNTGQLLSVHPQPSQPMEGKEEHCGSGIARLDKVITTLLELAQNTQHLLPAPPQRRQQRQQRQRKGKGIGSGASGTSEEVKHGDKNFSFLLLPSPVKHFEKEETTVQQDNILKEQKEQIKQEEQKEQNNNATENEMVVETNQEVVVLATNMEGLGKTQERDERAEHATTVEQEEDEWIDLSLDMDEIPTNL